MKQKPRKRSRLPRFTDRKLLGSSGLRVSPFCLGRVESPNVIAAAYEAGINFFFVSADLHWPRYEHTRRGLSQLFASHPAARDEIVVAAASYPTQLEFCAPSFRELVEVLPGLGSVDVLVAGGAYGNEFLERAQRYHHMRRTRWMGASAIGATFHDRTASLLATNHGLVDIALVRYNAQHTGAESEVFPLLNRGNKTLLYNFKSTMGWISPGQLERLGLKAGGWQPGITDHYRFVLSQPALDGVLLALDDESQLDALVRALEQGPLDSEERDYLVKLTALAAHRARTAPKT